MTINIDSPKKILFLGGSAAQLIAIERAKAMGFFTVLCDYLPDNPGQYIADSFHLVSTTDKQAVLAVARSERIDGIVAYSSDPAAPTAAYVANALNLPGMDYDVVRHFCEKQLFRTFLLKHGFNVPLSITVNAPFDLNSIDISGLQFPVIVKPTDSSGSKGVTVIESANGLQNALAYAQEYSRNGILIIEEFIRRDHPYVIEAEVFAIDGEVVTWGLINSIRDSVSNPLLPAAYSYPLDLPNSRKELVKKEVSRLIGATGKTSGAFNIEMIIDKHDRLFFLDAGPRNGGNMLPEFISMIARKDLVEATIKAAMGDTSSIDVALDGQEGGYWGLGVLHTSQSGVFDGIEYSGLASQALVREEIQKRKGEQVRPFERCNDLVGLSFLHFKSKSEMDEVMSDTNEAMRVLLK